MPDENDNPVTFLGVKEKFQQFMLELVDYPELEVRNNDEYEISGVFETEDKNLIWFQMKVI